MSKVKNVTGHEKEKHKHILRRKEDKKIKNTRKENAKNDVYWYGKGYYLKHERWYRAYEKETIPAETKEVIKLDHWERIPAVVFDDEGNRFLDYTKGRLEPVYKTETVHYPERIVKKLKEGGYKEVKPYLRRINIRKKWYKRMAAKAARKVDLANGRAYKKAYDIAWSIW